VPEDRPIQPAGQPFTFGGVARFAHAPVGRLLLVALIFGLLTGLAVTWLGVRGWAPAIDEAVAALPETGAIRNRSLSWPERAGRLLGANEFLSLEVVLQNTPRESGSADVSIEAHRTHFLLRSIFGAATVPYPPMFALNLDRATTVPAWGAWRAPLLFGLIPGTALVLMLSWAFLAIPYSLVALLIGGLFRRDLNFRKAWKLCVATQMPGSLLMTFAIALYASGQVAVLFIAVMLVAHFIPTFLYLLISPVLVPKRPRQARAASGEKNPFDNEEDDEMRGRNPFSGERS
jgi:hypothetical protein